jgi:5-methylcytosine-specific restriction endonuclease McrA
LEWNKLVIILSPLICSGIIFFIAGRITEKSQIERNKQIRTTHNGLIEDAKKKIEERAQFYNGAEWSCLRKQVIREEGRICSHCKKYICDEEDFIVIHKYPRSKYPHLELERDNLQIICNKCNRDKVNIDWCVD